MSKKDKNILTIFILIGVAIICGTIYFVFYILNSISEITTIKFESDSIPTIYSVIGKRKIMSYNSNKVSSNSSFSRETNIVYAKSKTCKSDNGSYAEALLDMGYFNPEYYGDEYQILVKNSEDKSYIIEIEIVCDSSRLMINYYKYKEK